MRSVTAHIRMGSAHGRTKPRTRGPWDRWARNPIDGARDVTCRAGNNLGVRAVEVEDDHVSVVGKHVCARSELVDPAARAHLSQQVHLLTRCKPLAVLRHTSRDVAGATSVSAPNGFLTRRPCLDDGSGSSAHTSRRTTSPSRHCAEHDAWRRERAVQRGTGNPQRVRRTAHSRDVRLRVYRRRWRVQASPRRLPRHPPRCVPVDPPPRSPPDRLPRTAATLPEPSRIPSCASSPSRRQPRHHPVSAAGEGRLGRTAAAGSLQPTPPLPARRQRRRPSTNGHS